MSFLAEGERETRKAELFLRIPDILPIRKPRIIVARRLKIHLFCDWECPANRG